MSCGCWRDAAGMDCFLPGSQRSFSQSLAGSVPTAPLQALKGFVKGQFVPRSEGTVATRTGCQNRLSGRVGVARQGGEGREEDRGTIGVVARGDPRFQDGL